ncbi:MULTISPECIES: sigma-54 dependent transcriptional regulator [unclassified Novosphingobium]|jgi:two-component system nitrogen regulation response regulator NtrX|uniref:nitrogen assimilation response regulator NtrX n=1 Tax=unclassified Novosphingobium TaxID=2644732 RepID=UPI00061C20F9|nr:MULTISPECIES: sigma-54 dependent transcriptional regulator [unclassified Novosphingobium]ODU68919.1 MAG: sigma-54-dependent Fis family transcriptional regulator [Novosphingobium sp. SCN 66-18]MBF5092177.1 sigma-54-dependent Fis family transcriptional regulator [Novosphingobium sp. NBM11]QCI92468.1 sigma-54-dependent Fis family transcriptional regulator [Novosphingobium sp. EMRT-2]RQW45934.1 sigma-54-dependent Fis family transcriptional regulator [Novosphingobium sp. LASN5T]GAO56090.1 nitrog
MALDILIVDDERDIRELVAGVLSDEGYGCRLAADSTAALAAIDERRPSLVLLDVWLHGSPMDGLEVLDEIKKREPELPVIIFSGHGGIDTAVSAISRGAMDFIEKPFEAERLLLLVERATETERLRRENARLRSGFATADEFTGNSSSINAVRATLKRVANTGSRLLISGPAGSGKEVAARLLHSWSPRAQSAFVTVNSARITPERFEQELFGEEADGKLVRAGLLEMADGGTLFLDEVADMPPSSQARILRVLTEQSFVRVGGHRQIRVDVRVVSSSSRPLEKEIAERRFREDLYYRLNVVPVTIPSLAERRDDIPALVDHFFTRYATEQGITPPAISPEAMAALQSHDWPGNVRELRNVVERTVILAPRDRLGRIDSDMLPSEIVSGRLGAEAGTPALMGVPLREARENFEREYLKVQIRRFSGNISKTANFIGMERSALHRKLKLLGMVDRREDEIDD